MDNEASFKTDWVQSLFSSKGIIFGYFPVGLGNLMNPCDNNFHSVFKRNFYSLLAGRYSLNKVTKFRLAKKAYYQVHEQSIKNFFSHVGLSSNRSPKYVVADLLTEGIYPRQKYIPIHVKQLKSYLSWRKSQGKSIPSRILWDSPPELLFLRKHFV
jgi:hypothetical protein